MQLNRDKQANFATAFRALINQQHNSLLLNQRAFKLDHLALKAVDPSVFRCHLFDKGDQVIEQRNHRNKSCKGQLFGKIWLAQNHCLCVQ